MNFNIDINKETENKFIQYAKDKNDTVDNILTERLIDWLEDIEDFEAIKDYEDRKAHGNLKTYSFDEVKQQLSI